MSAPRRWGPVQYLLAWAFMLGMGWLWWIGFTTTLNRYLGGL